MLGCAPLGGLYHQIVNLDDVRDVLKSAIFKHNIRDIDTAPWYGHGKSESDIGRVLADRDSRLLFEEQEVRIYTKVGRVMKPRAQCNENDPNFALGDTCYAIVPANQDVVPFHDYTAGGVRESVAQSMERLKLLDDNEIIDEAEGRRRTKLQNPNHRALRNRLHRIASLRLHDCDGDGRFHQATAKGGIMELLRQCDEISKGSGCACEASIGMNEPEDILRILKWSFEAAKAAGDSLLFTPTAATPSSVFQTVMMAGCWNLMDQSGLVVMEYCDKHNIQVHNAGVFGAGLLWGVSTNYKYRTATKQELEKRDRWNEVAQELGVSLPALAFAFAYLPRPVSKICFGAATAKQLDACVAAADESVAGKLDVRAMIRLGEKKGLFGDHPGAAAKCLEWVDDQAKNKMIAAKL